jgi:hypothetical protein
MSRHPRSWFARFATIALLVGCVAVVESGFDSPASAWSCPQAPTVHVGGQNPNTVLAPNVSMRNGPSTNCLRLAYVQPGHQLDYWCYTLGTSVFGNPFWTYVTNWSNGVSGWVSDYYLTNSGSNYPC